MLRSGARCFLEVAELLEFSSWAEAAAAPGFPTSNQAPHPDLAEGGKIAALPGHTDTAAAPRSLAVQTGRDKERGWSNLSPNCLPPERVRSWGQDQPALQCRPLVSTFHCRISRARVARRYTNVCADREGREHQPWGEAAPAMPTPGYEGAWSTATPMGPAQAPAHTVTRTSCS